MMMVIKKIAVQKEKKAVINFRSEQQYRNRPKTVLTVTNLDATGGFSRISGPPGEKERAQTVSHGR